MKTPHLFLLPWLFSTVAFAAPAGEACKDRVIDAIVAEMVSPCGAPIQGKNKDVLYVFYTDMAEGSPHHISAKYCGFDSSFGLGRLRVRYKSARFGDCRIVDIKDLPN